MNWSTRSQPLSGIRDYDMVPDNPLDADQASNVDRTKKRLIVVLGMHRSGTSAITRALQVMGVKLGDNLMPATENDNAKGFWEDLDFHALNNELLSVLGSDWHHLAPIEPSDVETLRKNGYFARAVELLCQKVDKSGVFGFKDPRVAKLLPFWKEVFACCQLDASFVLTVRHPLSVAKSLTKRDGFDAEKSYFLWLGHVIESLSGSAGQERVLVDYDKLIQSPEFEVNRVANRFGLETDAAELEHYLSGFLDKALRHTVYDLNDLSQDEACPPLVREIYATLLDVASDKISFDDQALQNRIARWVEECERLKPILTLADRLFTQNVIANQAHFETNTRLTAIENSTLWKLTFPLRRALSGSPLLRIFCRRTIKLIWWASTFQLGKRLRERRARYVGAPHFAPPANDYCLAVPLNYSGDKWESPPRIAVVCHMYYAEMTDEFQRYLINIPSPFDLFITTDSQEKQSTIENHFSQWNKGKVEIRVAPNRGRDIAPKLITCRDAYDKYEFILHIHTKTSLHNELLSGWCNYLLETLLGSEKIVESIFESFRSDSKLGMVAPQHFEPVRHYIGWGWNFQNARKFSRRLGVKLSLNGRLDFPSGSMFWARSAALKPLLDCNLTVDEFPDEGNQSDGTLGHVIERLYFFVCERAGYRWIKVCRPSLLVRAERVKYVESQHELSRFIKDTQYGLLESRILQLLSSAIKKS